MSYDADLKAIDVYIKGSPLYTAEATQIRDEWTVWYKDLGWFTSEEDYDHARNLRNRFNLANSRTQAEYARAKETVQRGMTSEEMAGGTSHALASGMYEEPLLSEKTRTTIALTALTAGLGGVAWLAYRIAKPF
jgi:hypothetical protein